MSEPRVLTPEEVEQRRRSNKWPKSGGPPPRFVVDIDNLCHTIQTERVRFEVALLNEIHATSKAATMELELKYQRALMARMRKIVNLVALGNPVDLTSEARDLLRELEGAPQNAH